MSIIDLSKPQVIHRYADDNQPMLWLVFDKVEDENELYSIAFSVWDMTGFIDLDDPSTVEFSEDPDLCEKLFSATVKWDGCSHMNFGRDNGYLHFCGGDAWLHMMLAIQSTWNFIADLVKNDRRFFRFDLGCGDFITMSEMLSKPIYKISDDSVKVEDRSVFAMPKALWQMHLNVLRDATVKIVTGNENYTDLGFDSIDRIEFVVELEEHYKIEIEDEDSCRLNTPNDVIRYLKSKNVPLIDFEVNKYVL